MTTTACSEMPLIKHGIFFATKDVVGRTSLFKQKIFRFNQTFLSKKKTKKITCKKDKTKKINRVQNRTNK